MNPRPPLSPPELAQALVHYAHELAEHLEALWCQSAKTKDRIKADQLDPLVTEAAVLASTVDAVHQRLTGQPMTTNIGRRLDQMREQA